MKNKNVRGILALVVVTALSFGVIAGSKTLSENLVVEIEEKTTQEVGEVLEVLDAAGAENIEDAVKKEDGSYRVTVREKGYGGEIVLNVGFDADAETVTGVSVTEQTETEGVGSRITESEFLSQFEGVKAPVFLPGMSAAAETEEAAEEAADELEGAVLADGTYEAKEAEADSNGFIGQVTMTVADGKITEVNWDYETEDGTKKSVMSENGEYVMTEDGPTWKEQAESLAAALVENQSLDFFVMDEQGKTDVVSGVSISIGGFVSLAEECMKEAAGIKTLVLTDGTYEAKEAEADSNGFIGQVTMTVAGGKITEVNWDYETEDGTKKSVMSENGEYVMTEDGPTWKEQAESLAAALVENQSLDFFVMDEQGKTDVVSGVSISIGGFVSLAEECLKQAAGEEITEAEPEAEVPAEGTLVDAVSGATISSTAAVKGINDAYEFLKSVK